MHPFFPPLVVISPSPSLFYISLSFLSHGSQQISARLVQWYPPILCSLAGQMHDPQSPALLCLNMCLYCSKDSRSSVILFLVRWIKLKFSLQFFQFATSLMTHPKKVQGMHLPLQQFLYIDFFQVIGSCISVIISPGLFSYTLLVSPVF